MTCRRPWQEGREGDRGSWQNSLSQVFAVGEIGGTDTQTQPKPSQHRRQPGQDLSDAPCHRFVGDLHRHAYEADARTETLCQIVRIDEFSRRRIVDVAKAQETWIKFLR